MGRQGRYSPEVRDRAVRLVLERQTHYESEWATICSIAGKIGCAETLRKWVRQAERDAGRRAGLTTSERQQLKQLQRENRELKRVNETLRKASAYFAQAELDCRRDVVVDQPAGASVAKAPVMEEIDPAPARYD